MWGVTSGSTYLVSTSLGVIHVLICMIFGLDLGTGSGCSLPVFDIERFMGIDFNLP